jgi:hypothetical protein
MVDVEEIGSDEEEVAQRRASAGEEDTELNDREDDASGGGGGGGAAVTENADGLPGRNSMPEGFQQLLELASHIKSAQPEVREKREQWERLLFHQRNTLLFQTQDAAVRYDLRTTLPALAAVSDKEAASAAAASAAAESSAAAAIPAASSSSDDSAELSEAASDFTFGSGTGSEPPPSPRFDRVRLPLAQALKSRAADLYRAKQWNEASMLYQRAVGLFQWARKQNTKDGDEIVFNDLLRPAHAAAGTKTATGEADTHAGQSVQQLEAAAASNEVFHCTLVPLSSSQRARAAQLVFTCLVNIAACEEQLGAWHNVVAVCEAALAMDMRAASVAAVSATDAPEPNATAAAAPAFQLTPLTIKALFRAASAYNRIDELDNAVSCALACASRCRPLASWLAVVSSVRCFSSSPVMSVSICLCC